MADRRNAASDVDDSSCQNLKYKGVRKRKWGKWVSEIRLPNSRDRIWLGSYDKPEKAARAFDAAQFCLRGPNANFNFPDSPPDIAGGHRLTSPEIRAAAAKFAEDRTASSDDNNNVLAGEVRPEERDGGAAGVDGGAFVWPELDGGWEPDFDYFMGRNEMLYDSDIIFPVQEDMEEDELVDSGGYFYHESNFLWNFGNH
ncbi:ethylene-responsive transcription factor ERF017-like [Momordica charantia]|uniref:Ethylene-responsive transcription factor ERF017-like n=1 Tax=Momordica charantia TaxID=3673 RepID=A0A6J1CJF4_MOMCH|nr:ethylene-responsive transcription factor ERF017-like [Momordica charantia]